MSDCWSCLSRLGTSVHWRRHLRPALLRSTDCYWLSRIGRYQDCPMDGRIAIGQNGIVRVCHRKYCPDIWSNGGSDFGYLIRSFHLCRLRRWKRRRNLATTLSHGHKFPLPVPPATRLSSSIIHSIQSRHRLNRDWRYAHCSDFCSLLLADWSR